MAIRLHHPERHIALVEIANPARRNALGPEDFQALARLWDMLAIQAEVRCIVVTGEGDRAFCSGAQLDADFSHIGDVDALVDQALLKTRLYPKPLVAAVNGHCVAGGFELMLAADIRVASEAARLGLPEVRWGILPSGGAAMKLIGQIGHARAMELMLTGELVEAHKAAACGLVNEVVPQQQVLDRALALARRISANSPVAVAKTKESALTGYTQRWAELEPAERDRARHVRAAADVQIGKRAFLAKTDPVY